MGLLILRVSSVEKQVFLLLDFKNKALILNKCNKQYNVVLAK